MTHARASKDPDNSIDGAMSEGMELVRTAMGSSLAKRALNVNERSLVDAQRVASWALAEGAPRSAGLSCAQ